MATAEPRKEGSDRRLYLIDGYNVIFRAFYALPPLSTSKGDPTNAVLGFVNMLRKLLREQDPSLVGVAWDVSSKTFRKERFEDYKANRKPMPDDLRAQIPYIRKTLEAFRIPILEMENYEADDVLGTLARKARDAGYDVILVSADKDLMQLVGDGIFLLHTSRDKLYDAAMVEEDFGVPPDKVVDVLALMGDSVDNVPGVPGIGEKGAKKLIQEHGSVEALIEKAPELKFKKHREGLQDHADDARLSKELVTIETDLPIDFEPDRLAFEPPDAKALAGLYRELEFFPLLKELESESGVSLGPDLAPAVEPKGPEAWLAATAGVAAKVGVAVVGAPVLGVAVATTGGDVLFADFRRQGLREASIGRLREWLAEPDLTVVGHDLKEVLRLVDHRGPVAARLADTMLLAYLLRSSVRDFSFEEVCMDRLQVRVLSLKDAGWGKGAEPLPGDGGLLELAAQRAALPLELDERIEEEVAQGGPAAAAARVYAEIEEPLVPVLVGMEEAGIRVDTEFLAGMSGELEQEIAAVEAEIYEIAGEEFNIGSPQQLGAIMFEKLDYPVLRRTRKTKSYATGADVLEELAARGFDLPARILSYRELTKLKSTYVDALPALVA
ncbi:MAG: DNA polymerase, partial [Thermoanaerobaculia bacterium]|nr:DNA polymerase [Thermoanaerobaculia bacterium]